jgi:hypothetical protein
MNIPNEYSGIYSSVTHHREIPPPVTYPYIPRLVFLYLYNPRFGCSPDGEPSKHGTYSSLRQKTMTIEVQDTSQRQFIVFTTIHNHRFMINTSHIAQFDHGVVSLPMPLPSPSLDPPMFRTSLTKSGLTDEEGRLKT